MIDLDVELAVSCKVVDGQFKVYIVKNHIRIDITPYLSEHEIKSMELRFDVKKALDENPAHKGDDISIRRRGP